MNGYVTVLLQPKQKLPWYKDADATRIAAGDGHTLAWTDCDGVIYGYLANQSTTAPSFAQCGGDVIVNVPKTTVENTVNVEPTPIEVIVPEPPRSVLSVGWSGDNLLLTYSDGSNQTIATPVC